MGLFSRRRYAEGTVPDHVEELDGGVLGPPPASYPQRTSSPAPSPSRQRASSAPSSYPSPRHAPEQVVDEAHDDFYDDEDSEDRPEPGVQDKPRFLPPPPTRMPKTRRAGAFGFVVFGILFFLARAIVAALPDGGSGDGSSRWSDVPDVYAEVAAEPERQLTSQGVRFQLVANRPLDPAVCSFLEGCLAGAAADWEVTGTAFVGRSWFLVFEDEAAGDAAAVSDSLRLAIAPGVPSNWAIRAGSPGRFLVIAGVGPADGGAADVSADPVAVEAADALRIWSTVPAVSEITNR